MFEMNTQSNGIFTKYSSYLLHVQEVNNFLSDLQIQRNDQHISDDGSKKNSVQMGINNELCIDFYSLLRKYLTPYVKSNYT